jgi:hypothetical protein
MNSRFNGDETMEYARRISCHLQNVQPRRHLVAQCDHSVPFRFMHESPTEGNSSAGPALYHLEIVFGVQE